MPKICLGSPRNILEICSAVFIDTLSPASLVTNLSIVQIIILSRSLVAGVRGVFRGCLCASVVVLLLTSPLEVENCINS